MKTNNPHEWQIWLHGKRDTFVATFTGRLDEALAHADELESGVRFVVTRYEVIRGKRAAKPSNHLTTKNTESTENKPRPPVFALSAFSAAKTPKSPLLT